MDRIRVLLVDDHTIMREGLRALLSYYEDVEIVGEARSGEEAVSRVDDLRPDVVLMDIAMPGITGIEATREIKARSPETQVLVLSQHEERQYVLPVVDAGAAGYLLKRTVGTDLIFALRAVAQGESFLSPLAASILVEECRRRPDAKPAVGAELTSREREILRLIARGLTNQEIARELMLSPKTVEWHRMNLMSKAGAHNAVELTRYALRRHLVDVDDQLPER